MSHTQNHLKTATQRRPLRPEELFNEALELKQRAEEAEAELEDLRTLLKERYTDLQYCMADRDEQHAGKLALVRENARLEAELAALKSRLNQTNQ